MNRVIIFGANRGIGLSLAKKYLDEGFEVTTINRSESIELEQLNSRNIYGVDVCDLEKLRQVKLQLEGSTFDLLIHNAGIWMEDNIFDRDQDFNDFTNVFEVNAVAPLKVVSTFKSMVAKGASIGFLSSRMGSIADNSSGGRYGYRMSKAALNAGAKSLAIDLASDGIKVVALHPGFVRTDMTKGKGLISTEESAEGLFRVLQELRMENSGTFWHSNGQILDW